MVKAEETEKVAQDDKYAEMKIRLFYKVVLPETFPWSEFVREWQGNLRQQYVLQQQGNLSQQDVLRL